MTFIRKRDDSKDSEERSSEKSLEKKCFKKKEDILKQSIKTVGFEDSTQFFIQSGIRFDLSGVFFKDIEYLDHGRVDFIVGGIVHTVLLNSLYSTLPASRLDDPPYSTALVYWFTAYVYYPLFLVSYKPMHISLH